VSLRAKRSNLVLAFSRSIEIASLPFGRLAMTT
jgi:hypothetical protein